MAHDPFAPPRAELEVDEDLAPVPMRVKVAVMAIIGGEVMSFAIRTAIAMAAPQGGASILIAAISLAVSGIVAWKIFVGRDWARWILGLFVALGIVGLALSLNLPAQANQLPRSLRVASVLQLGGNLFAFVLLFTGEGAKWFRR